MDATPINATQPEVVDYPTIRIQDQVYLIKITCGTLMQLKREGIDLFAKRPFDSNINEALRLYEPIFSIKPAEDGTYTHDQQREREAIVAKSDIEWLKAKPEARDFQEPLAHRDFITRMENTFAVIAAAVTTYNVSLGKAGAFTKEQIAQAVDPENVVKIMDDVRIATKKVLSLIENALSASSGQIQ